MAVYSVLNNQQISSFLLLYDIGKLIAFKGIVEGIENSNFHLVTTKGDFILTLFEKRVDKKDLPFFINVMRHLNAKQFICPNPIIDKKGNYLQTLSDKPALIVNFLKGKSKTIITNQDCFLVGASMAKMHSCTHDFNMERQNSLSISGWEKLIIQCTSSISANKLDEIEPNIFIEIKNSFNFCKENWPSNLPKGFIHADMFPDNVFFKDNEISGVIDYYFSCTDFLVYDIAIALNAWCFNDNVLFSKDKCNSLINGYRSVRKLTKDELLYLPILSQAAALRFLLTRTYDWVHTPKNADVVPKNPTEYIKKLRFHQSANSLNHYGIL